MKLKATYKIEAIYERDPEWEYPKDKDGKEVDDTQKMLCDKQTILDDPEILIRMGGIETVTLEEIKDE